MDGKRWASKAGVYGLLLGSALAVGACGDSSSGGSGGSGASGSTGGSGAGGTTCADIGCLSYVRLTFATPVTDGSVGYTVYVYLDDRHTRCDVDLPSVGAAGEPGVASFTWSCDDDVPVTILGTDSFEGLEIQEAPASVRVLILRGNGVAYEETLTPDYEITPSCGTSCRTYQEIIEL